MRPVSSISSRWPGTRLAYAAWGKNARHSFELAAASIGSGLQGLRKIDQRQKFVAVPLRVIAQRRSRQRTDILIAEGAQILPAAQLLTKCRDARGEPEIG